MNALSREFLRARVHQREWMDEPGIEEARFIGALDGLRRVNAVTRGAAMVWPVLERWSRTHGAAPFRVLDVACGGGETVTALAKRFHRTGIPAVVDGCDVSPTAIEHARRNAESRGVDARFFRLDALEDSLPDNYDAIVCSLFLHHLPQDAAVEYLRRAAVAARRGIVVQDLVRSRAGWWLAYTGVRLLLCNDVCREDGPRSVECAFTLEEARALAREAGLDTAQVDGRFPCRFLLTLERAS